MSQIPTTLHAAANAVAAAPAATGDTGGIPVGKVLPIIAGILVLVIAWAAVSIGRKNNDGNTGRAMGSATVVLIAVGVFALAGVVTGIVAWMGNMFDTIFSG